MAAATMPQEHRMVTALSKDLLEWGQRLVNWKSTEPSVDQSKCLLRKESYTCVARLMAIRYCKYQPRDDWSSILDWFCREVGNAPQSSVRSAYPAWMRNCETIFDRCRRNGPLGFHALYMSITFAGTTALVKAFPDWDELLPIRDQPSPPDAVPLLDLDLHLYHLKVGVPVDYDVYWKFAEALRLSPRVPNRIDMGGEVAQAHVGTSSQAVASMLSNDEAMANTLGQRSLRPKPFVMHSLPTALRATASNVGSHLGVEEGRNSDLQLPREWITFVKTSLRHLTSSGGPLKGMVGKRAPGVSHGHLDRVQFMPDPLQVLLCVNPPREVSEVNIYYSGQCDRVNWMHGDVMILQGPCEVEASRVSCISVMMDNGGGPVSQ